MLTVNLVCVGDLKEKYLKEACNEYIKRLSRFCKLNIIEVAESTKEKEKEFILKKIEGYVVTLCVEGRQLSSGSFSEFIEKTSLISSKITFVIGGSEGLDEEIKNKSNFKFSFSEMTFPHQLMRVIFLEQLYRSFTINNNITYHK